MDNYSFQGALKSSLFYLRSRPRSVNEVVKKLRKKQIPDDIVSKVILELQRCGVRHKKRVQVCIISLQQMMGSTLPAFRCNRVYWFCNM